AQRLHFVTRTDVPCARPLTRAAAIVGNRGHVTDRGDGETGGLQGTRCLFPARPRALHLDFKGPHPMLLRFFRRVLGGDLRGIGGRFARTFESHRARRRPGNGIALHVGDRNHRIVEARVHMRDAGGDVLAFAPADARGFLTHSEPFRGSEPAAPLPSDVAVARAISSCRQLAWPDLCGSERWYWCVVRAPEGCAGGASRDSSRDPSAA